MAEIVLDQVSKGFADGTLAVRDASFTVHDGELFILVGPSGCGKSTLLNLIVGLESPTAGELYLDGRPLSGVDPKDRDMAMVFQSYALYPHLTVADNLAFPLKLRGLPKAEIQSRVSETAALLGIGDLLGRRPQNLSGGQRQRVAMGRAMVRRPKVFLLDEPLSNLDAQLRALMRVELASLQRRLGTTTVYVTHDQTEAMTLGDRVAILRAGEVQQVGTPREVYARPANLFVASFIGTPTMNLIPGRLDCDRLALPIGEWVLGPDRRHRLGARDGVVVAGLRPECITLADAQGAPSAMDFEARVELVDWLGAELFAHLDVGPQSFETSPALAALPVGPGIGRLRLVARLDPGAAVSEGDHLRLAVADDALHLFDAATGRRLGEAPGESTRTRSDAL